MAVAFQQVAVDVGSGAAAALAEGGHVLPVLDGLDEIPPPARAQVIAALNASLTARDQLILTSRRKEFTTAIHETGRPLTAAAVIVPKPITPQAAADYLTACLPSSPTDAWRQTLAALRSRTAPGLTRLTATPLALWLIRTVYIAPGADPIPLTGPLGADADADVLRTHLLDHVIPALIQARPPSTDPAHHFRPRRVRDPDATRRHLTYLARAFPPATTRDTTWWHIARTTPHIRSTVLLVFGIAFGIWFGATRTIAFGLAMGLVITFGIASWLVRASSWVNEKPGYADLRLRGRTSFLFRSIKGTLAFGLTIGFVSGLTIAFVSGLTIAFVSMFTVDLDRGVYLDSEFDFDAGFGFGIALWLGITLASGLITWAEQPTLASTSTPRSSWRADRALSLLRMVVTGLVTGLVFGPGIGIVLVFGPWEGLVPGLTIGLVFGLGAGLVMGNHHAWLVCTIAVARLAIQRRLPWRVMDFLDDAHRLGLLRAVGPVHQFRHAALHDHLSANDKSGGAS
ncbi:hypothetical protein EDD27_3582 [Nonomuraea polychroma]|uniref:NACHT domain-containing protein n=1 Tax=Nonomuraea polychroma TaxID=46176 RepID=A0A438M697_9ACTN|nr:hypothetical protein [Nonomuraea polychroma]RVX41113.1 hypothetical protein EDD27_3582 [Nonomuraea polychroma]